MLRIETSERFSWPKDEGGFEAGAEAPRRSDSARILEPVAPTLCFYPRGNTAGTPPWSSEFTIPVRHPMQPIAPAYSRLHRLVHTPPSIAALLLGALIVACNGSGGDGDGGSAFAPAIQLDPLPALTRETSLTITGKAPGLAQVEVLDNLHDSGLHTVSVTDGTFSVSVPLAPNKINHLYFTGVDAAGARTAPFPAHITNDLSEPTLFIDFPPSGATLTTDTVDVIGRVGDLLSGFKELRVEVNGGEAAVDVGNGTTGTFVLAGLSLDSNATNLIEVVAADALGNQTTRSISIAQAEIPAGVPFMSVAGGNRQEGLVKSQLPEQLEVLVQFANGDPLSGKVVTFQVTRSDGVLADAEGMTARLLQVITDEHGVAKALWTLGSDAGAGNNRVEAVSTDIAGSVFFCASARVDQARQINLGMGNNQKAGVGFPIPNPLSVRVTDGKGNGVGEVPVTFRVTTGGGSLEGLSSRVVQTDQTGMAAVPFTLGPAEGIQRVEANFAGNPGLPVVFTSVGMSGGPDDPTTFHGLVLDNVGEPIVGAECTLTVAGQAVDPARLTDATGIFEFPDCPAGPAELGVHGGTFPSGIYPSLHYDGFVVVEHASNSLPMPVLLPDLEPENQKFYDIASTTVLTVEGIEGLQFIVHPGSMKLPLDPEDPNAEPQDAPKGTPISVNQVHFDDIPMPLPNGGSSPFAWTLQPGGYRFDPPITVEMPNMMGLPSGSVVPLLSFNHDTGRFEVAATAAVSEDGGVIMSDAKSGLNVAGWGCACPPPPPAGNVEYADCADISSRNEQLLARAQVALAVAKIQEASNVQVSWEDEVKPLLLLVPAIEGLIPETAACIGFGPAVWPVLAKTTMETIQAGLMAPASLLEKRDVVDGALSTARLALQSAQDHLALISEECRGVDTTQPLADAISMAASNVKTAASVSAHLRGLVSELQETETIVDNALDLLLLKVGILLGSTQLTNVSTGDPVDDALIALSALQAANKSFGIVASNIEASNSALGQALQSALLSARGLGEVVSQAATQVSISGQTARPNASGSFRVQNVPASPAPQAIVAQVSIGNGSTYQGRSAFFVVENNQTTLLTSPIPVSTQFVPAPPPTILAVFPEFIPDLTLDEPVAIPLLVKDQEQRDITLPAEGTYYTTSNSAILSIAQKGLILPVGSGTGYITISNQGLTAVRRVDVSTQALIGTAIRGIVLFPDGTPAQGVRVCAKVGGSALTGPGGSFSITTDVALTTRSAIVLCQYPAGTSCSDVSAADFVGSKVVNPFITSGVNDAGVISLVPRCHDRGWSSFGFTGCGDPMIGGCENLTGVDALIHFDDGSGDALFAGGGFGSISGVQRIAAAKYLAGAWTGLGFVNGNVSAMSEYDDGSGPALYLGGDRLTVAGHEANIWKWQQHQLTPMVVINGPVRALAVFDDGDGPKLYAGGDFTLIGRSSLDQVPALRIARWDGVKWEALAGGGMGGPFENTSRAGPLCMLPWRTPDGQNELVVGGHFRVAGDVPCYSLASWSGRSWSSTNPIVANRTAQFVTALCVFDDGSGDGPSLYATGIFREIGDPVVLVNNIAQWNGRVWKPLGSGFPTVTGCGEGRALTVFDDLTGNGPLLYLGGRFGVLGGLSLNGIGAWNGQTWFGLSNGLAGCSSGTAGRVHSLAPYDDGLGSGLQLFVGSFGVGQIEDGTRIFNCGKWTCQ